ncbi:MAG: amidohydrolase family protein, partial [Planctomycetales bacterium]|nr:amidohydrolase family protein [Planctomycetales bacterium]
TLRQLVINDNEPSFGDIEFGATVGDLLKSRSGVYHPALYETKSMAEKRPKRGAHGPGEFWYYNNWDFNALGTIFDQLVGTSLFEEFEARLARPLGMQDFRRSRDTNYVAGKDSNHRAYPFLLSARDLARFGQLMLQRGQWQGTRLVSADWVRESTQSYSDTGASGGYGYMWWVAAAGRHFPNVELPAGSYSARGYRGHFLVVIPAYDLVVCHRVNTFQSGSVSNANFGRLLAKILEAKPADERPAPTGGLFALPDRKPVYDVAIRGGEVMDGDGKAKFRADVAIRSGRIVKVGDLGDALAAREIDARGRIVAPGFIDLHSHADQGLVSSNPARRAAPNLITQGITTVVVNQDGGGPLDLRKQRDTMRRLGVGLNVVPLLGHGTLREAVLGKDFERPATEDEVAEMQRRLAAVLRDGAFGLSAGLEYVPGRWSTPREMEALARAVAESQGVYVVHERSSGSRPMWYLPSRDDPSQPSMYDNLTELIQIADRTKATVVATHIKARGVDFWGASERMSSMIESARARGLSLYADQYAYNTSGSDGRIVLIPAWAFRQPEPPAPAKSFAELLEATLADAERAEKLKRDIEFEISRRGGAKAIVIVEHPNEALSGKSLAEFARDEGVEPAQAAIRLQLRGDRKRRGGARLRAYSMSERDVEAFAATPWVATSSDAGIALPEDGPVHPRFYGAFPRKIRRYALEKRLMSVEEAVRQSTSLPADIVGLKDRGRIREGAVADVVVFDLTTIKDTADAFQPHQYADGIEYVFVNGQLACEGQRWLGNLCGEVLTHHAPANAP